MPVGRKGRFYKKMARKPEIPYRRPCTYPLHTRWKNEPVWLTSDYNRHGLGWCFSCKQRQKHRERLALNRVWRQRRPTPDALKNFPGRGQMGRFGNKFAPPGLKWCGWGYHYFSAKRSPRGMCRPCHTICTLQAQDREAKTKPEYYIKREELIQDVVNLKAEKRQLEAEIEAKRKEYKTLFEEVVGSELREQKQPVSAPAATASIVVPKPPKTKPQLRRPKRRVAMSYT